MSEKNDNSITEKSRNSTVEVEGILPEHRSLVEPHPDVEYVAPVELKPSLKGVSADIANNIRSGWRDDARRSAEALTTIVKQQEAIEASDIDVTTGLLGRRAFERDANAFFDRADAGELAVLYLDVNGLKRVNDKIGHHAGDQYLSSVSQSLKKMFRPGDRIYRVGGDELIVMLSGDYDGEIMDNIKSRMSGRLNGEVKDFVDTLRQSNGIEDELYPGVSIGGSIKQSDDTVVDFLNRADGACEDDKEAFYQDIEDRTGLDIRR